MASVATKLSILPRPDSEFRKREIAEEDENEDRRVADHGDVEPGRLAAAMPSMETSPKAVINPITQTREDRDKCEAEAERQTFEKQVERAPDGASSRNMSWIEAVSLEQGGSAKRRSRHWQGSLVFDGEDRSAAG